MIYLKPYKKYFESSKFDLTHEDLLKAVGAKEVDIIDELKLGSGFSDKLDLVILSKNNEFFNSLLSLGLKKSKVESIGITKPGESVHDDYETFIKTPCRFMLIHDLSANELEEPKYLLFQSWLEILNKWDNVKLYKINSMNNFYDRLTSKTIELNNKYLYKTSNGGNDWQLQNAKETSKYKKIIRKDELDNLISKGIDMEII